MAYKKLQKSSVTTAPVQKTLQTPRSFSERKPADVAKDAPQQDIQRSGSDSNCLGRISIYPPSFEAPVLQPKLTIGAANDQYEKEADQVAHQVITKIHSPAFRTPEPQANESIQRQIGPRIGIRRKPASQGEATEATPDLEASIRAARSSGHPIRPSIREPMEQAFGSDFSQVRIHSNAQSDQLNRSIQARAFTTGQDIFFRQGEYNPDSRAGQELMAHELTHVVQQTGQIRRQEAAGGVDMAFTLAEAEGVDMAFTLAETLGQGSVIWVDRESSVEETEDSDQRSMSFTEEEVLSHMFIENYQEDLRDLIINEFGNIGEHARAAANIAISALFAPYIEQIQNREQRQRYESIILRRLVNFFPAQGMVGRISQNIASFAVDLALESYAEDLRSERSDAEFSRRSISSEIEFYLLEIFNNPVTENSLRLQNFFLSKLKQAYIRMVETSSHSPSGAETRQALRQVARYLLYQGGDSRAIVESISRDLQARFEPLVRLAFENPGASGEGERHSTMMTPYRSRTGR
ncbi:DUF4157 domain-containing protein [Laspinema sp. A4]|uniref:eCIS core domain-containing protein n=1 Tax=Laspinema sp. D2d TaxID=2953686 RepID=UPI0021BA9744|nr:DUF4157 domain-containing protein [Laspinema sp. D2d]MCT7986366.1 DUF4157 domain-containing protein [Laspinema sp. D2d]